MYKFKNGNLSRPVKIKKRELLHNFMRSVKIKCLENNWIYSIHNQYICQMSLYIAGKQHFLLQEERM